jgi:hypothetical protein
VVTAVRRSAQSVFVERLKQQNGLRGKIDLSVTTGAGGAVVAVDVQQDTLADAQVVANVIGNLHRATVVGGAKRYAFTLEFE